MRRGLWLALVFVLLVGYGFAGTLSIIYGDRDSKSFELNDSLPLTITIVNVPAHVHQVYVDVSPDLDGKVYCAPGLVKEEENAQWDAEFTCILLPGTYEGDVYFRPQEVDVDENGNPLADAMTTRLTLSVVKKEVWYTNYGYTNIGGSITVGDYKVEVSDADVVSAEITVYKGTYPVWAGVVFIGQEIKPADDIILTFNGYSEKRGQAFFTFKTQFPAAVSSSIEQYYVVVPGVVYADDQNKARVDIRTNCSTVEVCDVNDSCSEHDVGDDGEFSIILSVGDYTVKCKGVDVSEQVRVLAPVVITKTVEVEKKVDLSKECPSWFYGLASAAKMSYCSSVCTATPAPRSNVTSLPVSSDSAKWVGIAVVLAIVGYLVWKKYQEGGFSFGGSHKQFEETEKEVEAVPDIEG